MRVRSDRHYEIICPATRGRFVTSFPLHHVPSVVEPTLVDRHPVDLFQFALSHVCDPDPGPIEREAPRVSRSVGPDLRARVVPTGERIVIGYRVWPVSRSSVDVDPKDLAQQGVEALAVPLRIPTAASVPGRDVQVAVAPERQRPTVVVRVRLVDAEQDRF